jgi:hypothetical protein
MLKTIFLTLAVSCTTVHLGHAQIGASKAELIQRYGKAAKEEKILTAPYDRLVDDYCAFQHKDLQIYAGLKDGKAVFFMYAKKDKSRMSQDEVFAVLREAARKPDWVLLSGKNPNPRWRLGDASAYAYYYPEPDYNGAPARFVRVQTANLDAIYTKLRREDEKK